MGPEKSIEGARGFACVMGEASDLTRLEDGLGDSWEILANTYKPYPCGVVLNPVIDCCLELGRPISTGAVRRVSVTGRPCCGSALIGPVQ
jgi:2-methylcitrate dehydratase PrpD